MDLPTIPGEMVEKPKGSCFYQVCPEFFKETGVSTAFLRVTVCCVRLRVEQQLLFFALVLSLFSLLFAFGCCAFAGGFGIMPHVTSFD